MNLNMLNERCNDRDKTKEQCRCVSIVVYSKKWLVKVTQKERERLIYKDFYCLLACSTKMRNTSKTRKIRFQLGF